MRSQISEQVEQCAWATANRVEEKPMSGVEMIDIYGHRIINWFERALLWMRNSGVGRSITNLIFYNRYLIVSAQQNECWRLFCVHKRASTTITAIGVDFLTNWRNINANTAPVLNMKF